MSEAGTTSIEDLIVPDSREIEKLRAGAAIAGACTIYNIQAVPGIGAAGCMVCGIDYGRRPDA